MTAAFGDPRLPKRFWNKASIQESGCWEWTASKSQGYGRYQHEGAMRLAHRVSWLTLVGPAPDGLVLDHLCRNRACVNPAHMEPVTIGENTMRGIGPTAEFARRTHCEVGHELTPENTYLFRGSIRYCRECKREWNRQYRKRPDVQQREQERWARRHEAGYVKPSRRNRAHVAQAIRKANAR
jgi:hypothetical protein